MANVEDLSSNKRGAKTGNVFVVDPNPPGMDIIPPEDMFIYVKFSAYPRSRTTYGGNTLEGDPIVFDSGIEGEVNFISTKIKYKDGKLDPPLQKSYATTDWTNIGGFKDENSRSAGTLEGFGIKDISIKYNASLVPVVDITFTDVRGSGLFDVIKDNDRKSPYSIFFKMPYPVFRLSVKGYFGQKVDYCLHMVNWTSNFDGSTGNFDITANFLGFQQAFLNDMVLGNIIGTINTQKGFNNLNRIYDDRGSDIGTEGDFNIRKIDEFLTKISRIQIETEIIKSDLNSFEYLKDLNGKLKLLESIQSFIGKDIGKQPISNSNGSGNESVTDSVDYIKRENNNTKIFTSPIKDSILKNKDNYLSIRDFIVINSINRGSFKTYTNTLTDIIIKYLEYLSDDDRKEYKPENTLSKLSDKVKSKISGVPSNENKKTNKDDELIKSFFLSTDDKNWENYVVSTKDKNGKIAKKQLEDIISEFQNKNSSIYLKNDYDGSDKNANYELSLFSADTQKFYQTLRPETNVIVVDFRKQRELVEYRISELKTIIKDQQEAVQLEINEKILKNFNDLFGFKPTIDKCFEILSNNTQAMIETIYDISKESEQEDKSSNRNKVLKGYETDVPTGINRVAWPTVYQKNGDGSLEEIYIGEIGGVNSIDFPEWNFTEEVFDNLVSKSKELEQVTKASVLKNGLDTDNWFPINPIDYKINPWIKINILNDKDEIYNELIKQIFYRVSILQNYSRFDLNTGLGNVPKYANFESIAANKTIFNKNVRSILSIILKELVNGEIDYKDSLFFKENINQVGSNFYIKETDDTLPEYNNFNLSGKYNSKANYVIFDDNDIINNSKKLFSEIQKEDSYVKLTDPDNGGTINKKETGDELYYKNSYSSANNFTTNNIFNVWAKTVSKNLFISNNNDFNTDLRNSKLLDFNPSATTFDSKYLNKTNFTLDNSSSCDYEEILTQSEFYTKQSSNYSRALLLLSTFPFRTFEEGFLNSIFPNNSYKGARVVKLPKLYVFYLGGILWRYEQGLNSNDSVDFNVKLLKSDGTPDNSCSHQKFETSYKKYLNSGYLRGASSSKDVNIDIEDSLTSLPPSVKKEFINGFKNWVDGNDRFNDNLSGKFELNMTYYVSDPDDSFSSSITEKQKKDGETFILKELKETTNLIILNPEIFNPNRVESELEINVSNINQYIESFSLKFDEIEKNNTNGSETNTEEEKKSKNKSTNKIKLEIYNYFKNINSKWVGAEKKSFNICGGSDTKDLIDYFRFIDRGWRNIGEKATFNLKSFLTLGSNLNTSVYLFMSKLLRDSNFLFQILPNYINFKDRTEVAKIFQPQTTLQANESTGPIFCCIYVGGASEVLDIGERSNYYFKDDGFSFKSGTELPSDMVGPDDSSLVAFRVAFGAQNQTIFKNVSLNQQEHKETGEYFRALSDLVDKRGGTQKTYVGTDLLRLFKTRSYTCKVDALGCMNIQPLMYFDLQNVPFFNGAYLITSVNHNISPNHMTTNFQGVRQSKFISPPTEEITADLEIDLNESSDIPKIEFTNLSSDNPLYSIGVRNDIEGGDDFDFNNFNVANFKTLGIKRDSDEQYSELSKNLENIFKGNNMLTNSQVTMALTAMLSNSSNLNIKEKEVERGAEIRDADNNILYYTSNITGIDDPIVVKYGESYLASLPLSASTKDEPNTAYTIKSNKKLDEQSQNNSIENEKNSINNQISALDNTDSNYAKNKKLLEEKLSKLKKQEEDLIETTTYYNILPGDAYRFKPRGYLYLIGRKNYYDFYNSYFQSEVAGESNIKTPSVSIETEVATINTSLSVWIFLQKDKRTAYELSSNKNDGSALTFKSCLDIVYQGFGPEDEVSFSTFEKVLTLFTGKDKQPLIDYNNARGGINAS